MPLAPGQILRDRYRIDSLIGQGGMGAVYDGWDASLHIRVAIKENQIFTEAAQRQFEREARLLAALKHPNLPRVIDHFFVPGQGQYLVMDFIEGEDLKQRLASSGPQPEADALRWAENILSALAYLHKRNIIHRDIKPANIKITPDDEAVLVDFGIAKEYGEAGGVTTTGARGLTPGFASPEQYGLGTGGTNARSDLYSFAATLYALLTGDVPADALSRMMKPEKFVPVARRALNVSRPFAEAIDKALALDPDDRFASAAEMRAVIRGQPVAQPLADTTPAAAASLEQETEPHPTAEQVAQAEAPTRDGLHTEAAVATQTPEPERSTQEARTTLPAPPAPEAVKVEAAHPAEEKTQAARAEQEKPSYEPQGPAGQAGAELSAPPEARPASPARAAPDLITRRQWGAAVAGGGLGLIGLSLYVASVYITNLALFYAAGGISAAIGLGLLFLVRNKGPAKLAGAALLGAGLTVIGISLYAGSIYVKDLGPFYFFGGLFAIAGVALLVFGGPLPRRLWGAALVGAGLTLVGVSLYAASVYVRNLAPFYAAGGVGAAAGLVLLFRKVAGGRLGPAGAALLAAGLTTIAVSLYTANVYVGNLAPFYFFGGLIAVAGAGVLLLGLPRASAA